jgi:prophage regulatory protein
MKERFLKRREVEHLTSLSRSTIYSYITKGKFPRSISLGGRMQAWTLSSIENWIDERCGNSNEPVDNQK